MVVVGWGLLGGWGSRGDYRGGLNGTKNSVTVIIGIIYFKT